MTEDQKKSQAPQQEYDRKRDVVDVLSPGGHAHGILTGNSDPVARSIKSVPWWHKNIGPPKEIKSSGEDSKGK